VVAAGGGAFRMVFSSGTNSKGFGPRTKSNRPLSSIPEGSYLLPEGVLTGQAPLRLQ